MGKDKKPTVAEKRDFANGVALFLTSLGNKSKYCKEWGYPWVVKTVYGLLYIRCDPEMKEAHCLGSVYCRFLTPPKASDFMMGDRLNPYSGKWNYHYVGHDHNDCVDDFVRQLKAILPKEGESK